MSVTLNTAIAHGSLHREWRRLVEAIDVIPEEKFGDKRKYLKNYVSNILSARMGRGANVGMHTALKRMFGDDYETYRDYLENVIYDPEKTAYLKVSEILEKLKEVKGNELSEGKKVKDADGRKKRVDINNLKYINTLYKDLLAMSSAVPSEKKITAAGVERETLPPIEDRDERRKLGIELREEVIAELLRRIEKNNGEPVERERLRRALSRIIERYMKGTLKNTVGYEIIGALRKNGVFVDPKETAAVREELTGIVEEWRKRRDAEIERYAVSNPATAIDVKNVPPEVNFVIDASFNLGLRKRGKPYTEGPAEIFYKAMEDATGFDADTLMKAFKRMAGYSMDLDADGLMKDEVALVVYAAYRRMRQILMDSNVTAPLYLQPFSSFDRTFSKIESRLESTGMKDIFDARLQKTLFDLYGYDDMYAKIANSFNETAAELRKRGYGSDENPGWNAVFKDFTERSAKEKGAENVFEAMLETGIDPFSFERKLEENLEDVWRESINENPKLFQNEDANKIDMVATVMKNAMEEDTKSPEVEDVLMGYPVGFSLTLRYEDVEDGFVKSVVKRLGEIGSPRVASHVADMVKTASQKWMGEREMEVFDDLLKDIEKNGRRHEGGLQDEERVSRYRYVTGALLRKAAEISEETKYVDAVRYVNEAYGMEEFDDVGGERKRKNSTDRLYDLVFEKIYEGKFSESDLEEAIDILLDKTDGRGMEWLEKLKGAGYIKQKDMEKLISVSVEVLRRDFHELIRDQKKDWIKYKKVIGAYQMKNGLNEKRIEEYMRYLENEIPANVAERYESLIDKMIDKVEKETGNAFAAFKAAVSVYASILSYLKHGELIRRMREEGVISNTAFSMMNTVLNHSVSASIRKSLMFLVYHLSNGEDRKLPSESMGLPAVEKYFRTGGEAMPQRYVEVFDGSGIDKVKVKLIDFIEEHLSGESASLEDRIKELDGRVRRRDSIADKPTRASGKIDVLTAPYVFSPYIKAEMETPWRYPGVTGGGKYEFQKVARAFGSLLAVAEKEDGGLTESEKEEAAKMAEALSAYAAIALVENDGDRLDEYLSEIGVDSESFTVETESEDVALQEDFRLNMVSPIVYGKEDRASIEALDRLRKRVYGEMEPLREAMKSNPKIFEKKHKRIVAIYGDSVYLHKNVKTYEFLTGDKLYGTMKEDKIPSTESVKAMKETVSRLNALASIGSLIVDSRLPEDFSIYSPNAVYKAKSDRGLTTANLFKTFIDERPDVGDAKRSLDPRDAIIEKILEAPAARFSDFARFAVLNAALLKKLEELEVPAPENVRVAVSKALDTFGEADFFPNGIARTHRTMEEAHRAVEMEKTEREESVNGDGKGSIVKEDTNAFDV